MCVCVCVCAHVCVCATSSLSTPLLMDFKNNFLFGKWRITMYYSGTYSYIEQNFTIA